MLDTVKDIMDKARSFRGVLNLNGGIGSNNTAKMAVG